jgi:hypothetical protein
MTRKCLAPCSPSWCPRAEGCLPRPAVTVWSLWNFTDFTDGLRKNHPCFHRFFHEININQPSSELGGSTIYGSTPIFLGVNFTGCSTNIHKWDDPNNSGVRGLAFHSDPRNRAFWIQRHSKWHGLTCRSTQNLSDIAKFSWFTTALLLPFPVFSLFTFTLLISSP